MYVYIQVKWTGMVKDMGLDDLFIIVDIYMKDSIKIIKDMGLGGECGMMAKNNRANGNVIIFMISFRIIVKILNKFLIIKNDYQ